jgi:hypothetical protein
LIDFITFRDDLKVETRIATVSLLASRIVRVETKPDTEATPEDLDELTRSYQTLLKNEKGLFLIVFGEGGTSDAATREKYASPERAKFKKAEAFVVNNLPHRIESNFIKTHFKPPHPVKVFTDEEKAFEWLKTFID